MQACLIESKLRRYFNDFLDGLVVMISACQSTVPSAGDQGSIPCQGDFLFFFFFFSGFEFLFSFRLYFCFFIVFYSRKGDFVMSCHCMRSVYIYSVLRCMIAMHC